LGFRGEFRGFETFFPDFSGNFSPFSLIGDWALFHLFLSRFRFLWCFSLRWSKGVAPFYLGAPFLGFGNTTRGTRGLIFSQEVCCVPTRGSPLINNSGEAYKIVRGGGTTSLRKNPGGDTFKKMDRRTSLWQRREGVLSSSSDRE